MTQAATPETFTLTRHAADPRADGASRVVHVSAGGVVIERSVGGVRMRLGVPVAAYRDLVIAVRVPSCSATLSLRHDDSDLDVVFGSGDAIEVARSARAWASVLGKPVAIEEACVVMREAFARRGKRPKPSRRSAFSRRRKAGDPARASFTFAGEREIIART